MTLEDKLREQLGRALMVCEEHRKKIKFMESRHETHMRYRVEEAKKVNTKLDAMVSYLSNPDATSD